MRRSRPAALVTVILLVAASCGDDDDEGGGGTATGTGGGTATGTGDGGDAEGALGARGSIDIWLSNNAEEKAWGEAMVDAWNADNPDEQISAQEIPAGETSEAVIAASITAGNAPCLIFNTAPAAVPQFQKAGGLVALDGFEDSAAYVTERSGEQAEQYRSPDGNLYQMPWKANPVMIFYNREMFEAAGLDPENPPLSTYDEFLATSRTLVSDGGAEAAIWPAPTSQFFQNWFDFYPMYIAASGKQLVEDGEATFASEEGFGAANLWRTMYDEGLAPREEHTGDAFADGLAAMATVGPWAVAVYGDNVDWGVVPVPTPDGMSAEEIQTFSDEKSIGMFTACDNQATAWDVMKFATSEAQDGALLEATGQMPMRTNLVDTYADYFTANPNYVAFAEQADRTLEVPNVANSIEVWQTLRDAWSQSVIFGEGDPEEALTAAAEEINTLVAEN
jgi:multiple sugar transport system substrate-binding protein